MEIDSCRWLKTATHVLPGAQYFIQLESGAGNGPPDTFQHVLVIAC